MLEASTNPVQWTKSAVRPSLTGSVDFTDTLATNYPQRFYRAVTPSGGEHGRAGRLESWPVFAGTAGLDRGRPGFRGLTSAPAHAGGGAGANPVVAEGGRFAVSSVPAA